MQASACLLAGLLVRLLCCAVCFFFACVALPSRLLASPARFYIPRYLISAALRVHRGGFGRQTQPT
ncbi:hypothetical protein LX36DRAFT_661173 [Colletotrichum falcatum]|nr:hypothetical protein LX36DRAFT_661173 [Colletotrichum falcatum]